MNKILEDLKEKITIIVVGLIVVVGGLFIYNQSTLLNQESNLGKGWYPNQEVLAGSVDNLVSLPHIKVYADSTTTPSMSGIYLDGDHTIDQLVETSGYNSVLFCGEFKGGTATSTFVLRQMGSQDGSNYFNVGTSTENWVGRGATTTLSINNTNFSLDPGTATTTGECWELNTYGYRFTRFILWGEDVSTDPYDGVQAWINVIKIDPVNR
jgi:hypothetical protein